MKPWMLLLLSGALLSGCGGAPVADEIHEDAGEGVVHVPTTAQTNIGLEIASVHRRNLERVVTATGIVAPDQTRYAHITPLGRGIVDKVHVNLGDRVRQGEALVSYDNIELGDLIGEYLNLRAGLQKIEAEREVAGKILERSRSLLEVEAIARQEFEVRQAQYDQAVASARSQEAEIARVEEKLHRFGLTDQDIAELKTAPHESPIVRRPITCCGRPSAGSSSGTTCHRASWSIGTRRSSLSSTLRTSGSWGISTRRTSGA
ncbi:MAG TPA: efflux RND transporter periplasmic adaptor subunit [Vicinamibacteria bacterium]|nr:efflux RND transporter periplasmic adaptor subunit [Vicinamibacteria bacterium]